MSGFIKPLVEVHYNASYFVTTAVTKLVFFQIHNALRDVNSIFNTTVVMEYD